MSARAALLALLLAACSGSDKPDDDTPADTGEPTPPGETGVVDDPSDSDRPNDTAPPEDTAPEIDTGPFDADGDGYVAAEDCDDEDADINPGATELCNDIDDDCDGLIDDDDDDVSGTSTWYDDDDDDGYGDPDDATESCDPPDGSTTDDSDCDDEDADTWPDAPEICDARDNDCDGDVDEGLHDNDVLLEIEDDKITKFERDGSGTSTYKLMSGATRSGGFRTMAVDADAGLGYAVGREDTSLYEIDVCSGRASKIGKTGLSSPCGLVIIEDGRLLGVIDATDTLVSYDMATGDGTTVAEITLDGDDYNLGYCGGAWDCATDSLFVYDRNEEALLTIDPDTAEITDLLYVGLGGSSTALEVDTESSTALVGSGGTVYEVDLETGDYVELGDLDGDDLAWFPECE